MYDAKTGNVLPELVCGHCPPEWSIEKLNWKYGPQPATSV